MAYERNLGKGYALRTGSAVARGKYVAWVDSDMDLDPAGLWDFLELARKRDLDAVVGSKRHPDSVVSYPTRRRLYSWLYQQLVRALFRLDVRDTQVGMKLFRREVLEEVMPVVLVKRYAFDLEILAVARSFGFVRIAEAPIRLDYKFGASGVNWRAIAQALWDTAAIFYRLRLLALLRATSPSRTTDLRESPSGAPEPYRRARAHDARRTPGRSRALTRCNTGEHPDRSRGRGGAGGGRRCPVSGRPGHGCRFRFAK